MTGSIALLTVRAATELSVQSSHRSLLSALTGLALSTALLAPSGAKAACEFLMPLGGNGNGPQPWIVKKQVERPKGLIGRAVGRTNWNTDFEVSKPFRSFKLFFTSDSTDSNPGAYPVQAFLKFTDGTNQKVVDQSMKPPTGTGKQFGPFIAPAGKSVSQVNFRVGANNDPGATGFSYRISVQGCH